MSCELSECARCGRKGCRRRRCPDHPWITMTPSRSELWHLCEVCDEMLMVILDATITTFVANKKEN